jgi:4-amino-4-deoxy-L-arabinose transferase-like glycosyltransferase
MIPVTVQRSLLVVCLIAAIHGLLFIAYQRPDWYTQWTDQDGYRRLATVLASTGKFTRYPDAPRFVPEVIRTPVYPAFVAVIYKVFGTGHAAVALAQTGVFIAICLTVFAIGRLIGGPPLGIAAAAATALFPTLPYFGALVLTEVWTTLMFTLTMWLLVRAVHEQRPGLFAWFGVVAAATTLSRPAFFLFLPGIVVMAIVLFPLIGWRRRPASSRWAIALGVYAIAMLPWFTYNYVTMHRFTLSPAGGIGRGIWEGSWQGYWPGRVQSQLTDIADQTADRSSLDAKIAQLAATERLDPAPMITYAHQWQDIRKIWTEPVDPIERAIARVEADNEYLRVGLQNSARDRKAHLLRRITRGLFVLWAADIPIRYSQINQLPPLVIRAVWLVQAAIFALALAGLWALVRARRSADAFLLAAPIIYVTAVHFPLLTEARQSLPAKPIVLVLAVLGAGWLAGRSFALEPQVHEGQHL